MKHQMSVSTALLVLMLTSISIPMITIIPPVRAAIAYDSGNPTAAEQLVLEYVNRARSNPIAEGQRLGIDIHEGLSNPNLIGPRPPLAMNKILLSIAEAHTRDMYNRNYFSHNDPNGTTPFDRMTHAGYNYLMAGENMAAGVDQTAAALEDFMMVDSGTPGRPHRVNLLDLLNPYPCASSPCAYAEIGIGYYGTVPTNGDGLNSLITEDFGATSAGPFLLGVVYNDMNGNNFYDIGEGISGVTITTSLGSYYAISSSSGGYAIPVGTSGTITVTASGPGFGPFSKTVTLTGSNLKLDFTQQSSSQTVQSTSQTSQSITLSKSTTQTSYQSTSQLPSGTITFQSTPSAFPGATMPGLISACGSKFANGQSTTCPSNFMVFANLPTPPTGWQFNHWTWSGGVTCSNDSANPTSCSATAAGALMAVYSAQITVLTNPTSTATVSWVSCANPGQGNGSSFYSTNYGASSVTACYVPYGYTFSGWSCTGGVACSSSTNPTVVSIAGPGTVTLNLVTQTNVNSTTSQTTLSQSSTSLLSTSTSQNLATLTESTSTYSTSEFGLDQFIMVGALFSILLIVIRRKDFRKRP